jgi:potassium-transporting ATPase KdpC subunit
MKKILKALRPALICFLVLTVICGVIYPGIVTGFAQLVCPKQANGSIISVTMKDGTKKDFGSELIAQEFTEPKYLIGRPMGTTNLSPVSKEQQALIEKRVEWWHNFDPQNKMDIPMDLVTASGSGVDPNISPAAAEYQVARIACVRGISESTVRTIIKQYTTNRFLGLWGEPAVNVLKINLALDGLL